MRHRSEPVPCSYCGEMPFVEECSECDVGCILCVNEQCPVEPEALDARTHEERLKNWNEGKFAPEPDLTP